MRSPKSASLKSDRKAAGGIRTLDRVVLTALAKPQREQVFTVRVRAKGSVDRRLIVKASRDPKDRGAVLLHVSPASAAPLPAALPPMLTTQEAADRLNVSRPYIAQLVDAGRFKDVQRTRSGHRRIPVSEVERMAQEMRVARSAGLDAIAGIARPQLERELLDAKAKARRRWVAKSA